MRMELSYDGHGITRWHENQGEAQDTEIVFVSVFVQRSLPTSCHYLRNCLKRSKNITAMILEAFVMTASSQALNVYRYLPDA